MYSLPRPAASALRQSALACVLFSLISSADASAQSARRDTATVERSEPRLATPAAISRDARSFARRVGLWASAGGGRGSAGLQCASCRSDVTPAFMGHLAVGGEPHERFHVGVETWMWLDVIGNGIDRLARGTQVIARHYPSTERALFVIGGIGTSRFSVDDGDARFDAASPALSLGLGWDVPFRGVILSPSLSMVASTGGALTSNRTGNVAADNARLGMWRSTLAITWF
jgi:hypothetical protein